MNVDSSGERGLLGIAFDPNFLTNNFVYVYYTVPTGAFAQLYWENNNNNFNAVEQKTADITSRRGNSRNSSRPSYARRSDHCASWSELLGARTSSSALSAQPEFSWSLVSSENSERAEARCADETSALPALTDSVQLLNEFLEVIFEVFPDTHN